MRPRNDLRPRDSSPELLAALALYTSISASTPISQIEWLLLEDGSVLTTAQFIDRVALLTGPTGCSASRLGARIAVRCSPWELSQIHPDGRLVLRQLRAIERAASSSVDSAVVLVKARGLSQLLDIRVVISFLEKYYITNTIMSLSGDDPEAVATGALARLFIDPGGDAELEEIHRPSPP